MAKLGLKDVLTLRAAGYSKKEIEALAAVDEESEKDQDKKEDNGRAPDPSVDNNPAQDDAADKESNPEPDYKQLYEDLKKQQEAKDKEIKEKDETIKKIQKTNINENNLPEIEKTRLENENSLIDALRSFY